MRKIIQITGAGLVLCDDGSLWFLESYRQGRWTKIKNVPQDGEDGSESPDEPLDPSGGICSEDRAP